MSAPNHAKLFVGFVLIVFVVGLGFNGDLGFSDENSAGAATRSLAKYADPYDENYGLKAQEQDTSGTSKGNHEEKHHEHHEHDHTAPDLPGIFAEAQKIMDASTQGQSKDGDDDCFVLYQDNYQQGFETMPVEGYDPIFLMNTCLELGEDIEFYGSTIKLLNGPGQNFGHLKCNGHKITVDIDVFENPYPVLWLTGNTIVQDCVVETINGRGEAGIVAEGQSLLENVEWHGDAFAGFYLMDEASVSYGNALYPGRYGFYMEDESVATYSNAQGAYYHGFKLFDNAYVSHSQASENYDGFQFTGFSSGDNLLAYANLHGFCFGEGSDFTSSLSNSYALGNHIGILFLRGSAEYSYFSSVYATDNNYIGLRAYSNRLQSDNVVLCDNQVYDLYSFSNFIQGNYVADSILLPNSEPQIVSCSDFDLSCIPLMQSSLSSGEDYIVDSGCVELWSDVTLQEDQSIILQNDTELRCNDYIIYGDNKLTSVALTLEDDAKVYDCIVENSFIAFDMRDSSEAYSCIARDNHIGYHSVGDDVEIFDSLAKWNNIGFHVGSADYLLLYDTVAEANEQGGLLQAAATLIGDNANFCEDNTLYDIQGICVNYGCPNVQGTVYAQDVEGFESNTIQSCNFPVEAEEEFSIGLSG